MSFNLDRNFIIENSGYYSEFIHPDDYDKVVKFGPCEITLGELDNKKYKMFFRYSKNNFLHNKRVKLYLRNYEKNSVYIKIGKFDIRFLQKFEKPLSTMIVNGSQFIERSYTYENPLDVLLDMYKSNVKKPILIGNYTLREYLRLELGGYWIWELEDLH